MKKEHQQ